MYCRPFFSSRAWIRSITLPSYRMASVTSRALSPYSLTTAATRLATSSPNLISVGTLKDRSGIEASFLQRKSRKPPSDPPPAFIQHARATACSGDLEVLHEPARHAVQHRGGNVVGVLEALLDLFHQLPADFRRTLGQLGGLVDLRLGAGLLGNVDRIFPVVLAGLFGTLGLLQVLQRINRPNSVDRHPGFPFTFKY